ncbi:MAG TPA: hypothetical protein VFV94_15455, partial [Polyangiaceae bacterium]|nr:hypothetical protein [Polyangiaceae bacterium]
MSRTRSPGFRRSELERAGLAIAVLVMGIGLVGPGCDRKGNGETASSGGAVAGHSDAGDAAGTAASGG